MLVTAGDRCTTVTAWKYVQLSEPMVAMAPSSEQMSSTTERRRYAGRKTA
jgi:hypothetical protein